MRFVLKAIFFLAVVAAFLPRQPEAEAGARPTAPDSVLPESALIDPAVLQEEAEPGANEAGVAETHTETGGMMTATGAFCDQRPALCQTAEESAFAFRVVGDIALAQARKMIVEAAAEPEQAAALVPAGEDTPAP